MYVDSDTLALTLRARRRALRFSQNLLADLLGLDRRRYRMLEAGAWLYPHPVVLELALVAIEDRAASIRAELWISRRGSRLLSETVGMPEGLGSR